MDYIDAATTGILSPHVLTIEDLRKTTFDHPLTGFIRRYTSILQIPMHPHFDCTETIPITNQSTHTGSHTTTQ